MLTLWPLIMEATVFLVCPWAPSQRHKLSLYCKLVASWEAGRAETTAPLQGDFLASLAPWLALAEL